MYDDVYNTKQGFIIPEEHIPSEEDMRRYALGDEEIVPILIEGMTGFIVNEIEWFLNLSETARPFREDCISEGLLALTVFVNKELGKSYSPMKFLNYAKQACLNEIKDWLREMSIAITVPSRSQQKKYPGTNLKQIELKEKLLQSEKEAVFDEIWYKQFIDELDGFDLKLVQMKIDGKSNREVGRTLGVTADTVRMHLDRLTDRLRGN